MAWFALWKWFRDWSKVYSRIDMIYWYSRLLRYPIDEAIQTRTAKEKVRVCDLMYNNAVNEIDRIGGGLTYVSR